VVVIDSERQLRFKCGGSSGDDVPPFGYQTTRRQRHLYGDTINVEWCSLRDIKLLMLFEFIHGNFGVECKFQCRFCKFSCEGYVSSLNKSRICAMFTILH
jgi:hypothetical protein